MPEKDYKITTPQNLNIFAKGSGEIMRRSNKKAIRSRQSSSQVILRKAFSGEL